MPAVEQAGFCCSVSRWRGGNAFVVGHARRHLVYYGREVAATSSTTTQMLFYYFELHISVFNITNNKGCLLQITGNPFSADLERCC
jgi:hypothetical protein